MIDWCTKLACVEDHHELKVAGVHGELSPGLVRFGRKKGNAGVKRRL